MTRSSLRRATAPKLLVALGLVTLAGLSVSGQARLPPPGPAFRSDFEPKDPITAKTPQEQAKTFVLPPGYRMELVLADPQVDTPAFIEFDGNGRMYVGEFITYMPDVEGTGQHDARNRISRWEDTNGDGTYDKRTVFIDNMVLPRGVLPLQDGVVLTNETASDDVIKWTDTNGDGVADRREHFFSGVGIGRDGNLEHEQSGYVWGLDNWIYTTYNSFRFRWTPTGILREPTGANQGQWGLGQDDDGKMWFVCAGCERGPRNFQFPIHYGAFSTADEYEPNFDIVWPISGVGDMQGGIGRVRMPTGVVNHATATAGPDIIRGHRLPDDLQGDLLYAEPVGRLIRRADIVKTDGLIQLRNVYPLSEFILSTDPLFRPVNLRTAPDGTVYIVDMYRGIIQEGNWTGPGSYLRHKIQQYQLDKVIHHGRIWRLRFDGTPAFPGTPAGAAAVASPGQPALPAIAPDRTLPRMYAETSAQLVAHLGHANGWWRDMAQRILVLKQDKSVVPALEAMVRAQNNALGRFHALWTLEGLSALTPALAREAMRQSDPRVRIQAIRASETLYKAGDRSLAEDYRAAARDADVDVALQGLLTLNVLKVSDAPAVIQQAMNTNKARGIQEVGKFLLASGRGRGGPGLTSAETDQLNRGATIYQELCFSCHGDDGRGVAMAGSADGAMMAPPIAGSPRVQGHRDYVIRVLLHGLTGPLNGRNYTNVMVPMGTQKDDWVAAIASYIRNDFGNSGGFVTEADVARVRTASPNRRTSWTAAEAERLSPVTIPLEPAWTVTTSHNGATAGNALNTIGWNSQAAQAAGMYFQIELPAIANVSEIQFTSPGGIPAGRAGGAGPGAAPAPQAPAAREYQVQLSTDGKTWGPVVARGAMTLSTAAGFPAARAKFVRVTQSVAVPGTGSWTVQNVRIYGPPAAK
jgi:mono/diheme cytochrome c family protein